MRAFSTRRRAPSDILFCSVFLRQAVAGGVGYVHHSGTSLDDGFNHAGQILVVGTAGILAIELHVLHIFLGVFGGGNGAFQNLVFGGVEFIFDVIPEVPMPVCMRLCLAYFSASAATSMSFSTARVRAQMVGHVTAFDISSTELKSPGLEMEILLLLRPRPVIRGFCNFYFFYSVQLTTGNLLAIPKGCVKMYSLSAIIFIFIIYYFFILY